MDRHIVQIASNLLNRGRTDYRTPLKHLSLDMPLPDGFCAKVCEGLIEAYAVDPDALPCRTS